MNSLENGNEKLPVAVERLSQIFHDYIEKRVCVVGSSCVGKSTLLEHFPEAVDMDDLLFGSEQKGIVPLLTLRR